MAVQVSRSGGIYIEISGDYSQLQKDLNQVRSLAGAAGQEISDALSNALSPKEAARNANNLTKYLSTAQRAAQATAADLSGMDKQFRDMGKAIGVASQDLGRFADIQKRMYQNQTQKAFLDNLKGIQRLTGLSNAEMNRLAQTMGGVGNEFSNASEEVKDFINSLADASDAGDSFLALAKGIAAIVAGYASMRKIGDFFGKGISSNANLQDAQTAIAATLTYTQKLADEQGRLLQGQEAYNAALRVSEDIAKSIDTATVTASADYNQLLSAFQSTLGPAAQVKATWQESLGLLTLMSNAMQVLNVDMERLDKEMLAFMTGRDFSNSQVARNLGISAETVKQWREGGKFVQEMTAALEKFKYAGEQAANSFKAVSRDLSSTVESLAGDMTKGLLERVTAAMKDLSRAFYTLETDGGKVVYSLRSEMAPLVTLGEDITTAFGDAARSAVHSLVGSLEGAAAIIAENRSAIDGVGTAIITLGQNIKPIVAAYVGWKVATSSLGRNFIMLAMNIGGAGVAASALSDSIAVATRRAVALRAAFISNAPMLAITAAAGAIAYLATQESAAEKTAKSYGLSLESVEERYKKISQGAQDAAKSTTQLTDSHRRAVAERLDLDNAALQKQIDNAHKALDQLSRDAVNVTIDPFAGLAMEDFGNVDKKYIAEFQKIIAASQEAGANFDELALRMRNLQTETQNAADGMSGWFNSAKNETSAFSGLVERAGIHLVALGQKSEEVDKLTESTRQLAGSVHLVANALDALDTTKVNTAIDDLKSQIYQAKRSAVGKASATALIKIGVDYKDIDQFGNVSQEVFAKYGKDTQEKIVETQKLARELHTLNAAAKSAKTAASSALSENRAVKYAEDAYMKAKDAAEQLRLKNIELAESLRGDTLAASLAKIGRQYQAQVDSIEKDTRDLLAKQEEWRKRGLLTSEVQAFIEQYKEQNQVRLQALEVERQYNEEIARRSNMENALGFRINDVDRLIEKMNALKSAYDEGIISLEQYNLRLTDTGLAIAQLHQDQGFSTFTEDVSLALAHITEGYEGVAAGLTETFGNFFSSFTQGFADSIGRAVVESENLGEALHNVAKSAISSLISSLVQLGIQYVVNAALGQSVAAATMTASTAMGVASATTLAAAYAPAAAAVSLASFGANAAPAMTGIAATYGLTQMLSVPVGFKEGGYTGNIGEDQVAGVVHGGEYVFDAKSVQRIGIDTLESMQKGSIGSVPASSSGGNILSPAPASPVNVSIENYGTSKAFEVEQLSESEIRVIARDEAREVTREYAPKVIASNIGNPNSAVSKSLGKNTKAERRR